jgi:hypothetical protein
LIGVVVTTVRPGGDEDATGRAGVTCGATNASLWV